MSQILDHLNTPRKSKDFAHFTPEEYLNEYYHSVFSENDKLLNFLARAASKIPEGSSLLEYGGGPTIYQLISFAPRVKTIHFTDYLDENILAVQDWINQEEHAHNWRPFVKVALEYEGNMKPLKSEVTEREELVRKQLHKFGHVDAFEPMTDTAPEKQYDAVSTNFVAESIAKTSDEWDRALSNIFAYLKPGGMLCMTAIRRADYWAAGGKKFPAYSVNAGDIQAKLKNKGFHIEIIEEIDAEITDPKHPYYEGYDGMIFLLATKSPNTAQ